LLDCGGGGSRAVDEQCNRGVNIASGTVDVSMAHPLAKQLDAIIAPVMEELEEKLRKNWDVKAEPVLLHWLCNRVGLAVPAWWPNQVKHPLPTTISMRRSVIRSEDLAAAHSQARVRLLPTASTTGGRPADSGPAQLGQTPSKHRTVKKMAVADSRQRR